MKSIYLLKDLARLTGHSIYTLKYYLKLGLVQEIGRGPETNFRYFDDTTVERLKLVRQLKLEGLSLKKIYEKIQQSNAVL